MAEAAVMDNRNRVKVPDKAADIAEPTVALLYDLNLLPTKEDLQRAGEAGTFFGGPPQSVALIEASATAVTKWWSAGGVALAAAGWTAVRVLWNNDPTVRAPILWSAAIVTAAVVLGIAHLLASDVRGRADAMVETITARRDIAAAFVNAAARATAEPAPPKETASVTGNGSPPPHDPKADTTTWVALAMQPDSSAEKARYIVVKGDAVEPTEVSLR